MDKQLLDILACPLCKGKLHYQKENAELICKFDQLAFPICDDIPVMITEKARKVLHEELEQL